MNPGARAVGYIRVSTGEQAVSGLGLEAQEAAIRAECERRKWQLVAIERDEGISGKTLDRPGFEAARRRVEDGEATVLVAAKLDRLSRSVVGLGNLLEWAKEAGADLVALDLGVDTSTATGRMIANVMASVAQWEREAIAERTKAALAAKRARGEPISRPSFADPEHHALRTRIKRMRGRDMSYGAIAAKLERDGVAPPRGEPGAKWHRSTIQAALYGKTPRRKRAPAIDTAEPEPDTSKDTSEAFIRDRGREPTPEEVFGA